jgi:DNA invertase Pin-like site-specific DNA recombinase
MASPLGDVFVEEGVSASVPVEERPVGGVLFANLERGDIVIAAKLDRLFRP